MTADWGLGQLSRSLDTGARDFLGRMASCLSLPGLGLFPKYVCWGLLDRGWEFWSNRTALIGGSYIGLVDPLGRLCQDDIA